MSKVSFWTKTSFRSSSLTLSRKTTREKWPSLDCRCRHISDDDKNLTIQAAFRTPMRRGLLLVTFRKRCVFFSFCSFRVVLTQILKKPMNLTSHLIYQCTGPETTTNRVKYHLLLYSWSIAVIIRRFGESLLVHCSIFPLCTVTFMKKEAV
jgi:hypothetical protein